VTKRSSVGKGGPWKRVAGSLRSSSWARLPLWLLRSPPG